jgi:hypothetical protein
LGYLPGELHRFLGSLLRGSGGLLGLLLRLGSGELLHGLLRKLGGLPGLIGGLLRGLLGGLLGLGSLRWIALLRGLFGRGCLLRGLLGCLLSGSCGLGRSLRALSGGHRLLRRTTS